MIITPMALGYNLAVPTPILGDWATVQNDIAGSVHGIRSVVHMDGNVFLLTYVSSTDLYNYNIHIKRVIVNPTTGALIVSNVVNIDPTIDGKTIRCLRISATQAVLAYTRSTDYTLNMRTITCTTSDLTANARSSFAPWPEGVELGLLGTNRFALFTSSGANNYLEDYSVSSNTFSLNNTVTLASASLRNPHIRCFRMTPTGHFIWVGYGYPSLELVSGRYSSAALQGSFSYTVSQDTTQYNVANSHIGVFSDTTIGYIGSLVNSNLHYLRIANIDTTGSITSTNEFSIPQGVRYPDRYSIFPTSSSSGILFYFTRIDNSYNPMDVKALKFQFSGSSITWDGPYDVQDDITLSDAPKLQFIDLAMDSTGSYGLLARSHSNVAGTAPGSNLMAAMIHFP